MFLSYPWFRLLWRALELQETVNKKISTHCQGLRKIMVCSRCHDETSKLLNVKGTCEMCRTDSTCQSTACVHVQHVRRLQNCCFLLITYSISRFCCLGVHSLTDKFSTHWMIWPDFCCSIACAKLIPVYWNWEHLTVKPSFVIILKLVAQFDFFSQDA